MDLRRRILAFALAGLLLGGCASEQHRLTELKRSGGTPPAEVSEQEKLRARVALTRYDQAVTAAGDRATYVPIGDLTGQLGDWEAKNGDFKRSLMAGRVVAAAKLPAAPDRTGEVVWDNGDRQAFPLIDAGQALDDLAMEDHDDCPDCVPLEATGARQTTMTVETTRGAAKVPAWEYALRGTAVRITRPAVAASAGVRIAAPSLDSFAGVMVESASTKAGSRELTVAFTGAPGPASQPCGADYTGQAVESANAVVVIVRARPHAGNESCRAIGAPRTAHIDLDRPLGERAVLELRQGLPVAVTITP